ncbi:hypothetical protein SAMN03159306_04159 [Pseudomonas sp. NFACC48-1]|nr:hypothetical protein SAMN03159424_03309 [Pseudomonas sp. NFACC05-1]SCZ33138.1 hypothetical protein SAMN03159405_02933 [Pseudomonas sp. NFACC44-2]SDA79630.1 hypothetical protein SAMN03159429_04011 [Pseudomonas sp. NFACC51]SDX96729.1 hypothetical protein SAMN03159474_04297 [Pseudomonas sp. NFACC08-1]SEJ84884.1 hypothetical protein SAMN03159298_04702 [Pseudomonas sp. NFACC07-1]SFH65763.1 hypothetical protein SAMN03159302_02243 [Pseudomonas sp. NFACC54]SFL40445.1 hypothetical protein SAMN03159
MTKAFSLTALTPATIFSRNEKRLCQKMKKTSQSCSMNKAHLLGRNSSPYYVAWVTPNWKALAVELNSIMATQVQ